MIVCTVSNILFREDFVADILLLYLQPQASIAGDVPGVVCGVGSDTFPVSQLRGGFARKKWHRHETGGEDKGTGGQTVGRYCLLLGVCLRACLLPYDNDNKNMKNNIFVLITNTNELLLHCVIYKGIINFMIIFACFFLTVCTQWKINMAMD